MVDRSITVVGMRPKNALRVSRSFDKRVVLISHVDTLTHKSPRDRATLSGDVVFCVSFLGHVAMNELREMAKEGGLRPHFVRGATSAVVRKIREVLDNEHQ